MNNDDLRWLESLMRSTNREVMSNLRTPEARHAAIRLSLEQAFERGVEVARAEQPDVLVAALERILAECDGPSEHLVADDTGNLVQVSGHNTLQRMIDWLTTMLGDGKRETATAAAAPEAAPDGEARDGE
jgi:hypothetical protein